MPIQRHTARTADHAGETLHQRRYRPWPLLMSMLLVSLFAGVATLDATAQADLPTASKKADLQVGGGFSAADPDYSPAHFFGYYIYTSLDFTHHYGVEFTIHQLNTTDSNKLYERTYEIGPRYVRRYGRFSPYIKGMVGRGVFNFIDNRANLGYNMYGLGAGVDTEINRKFSVRGEYEYQRWASFPPRGLQPNIISVGVAYHFF